MSIPPNLPGQRKAHPARHVFSIAGISLFTAFIIGSFFIAAVYLRTLVAENQLAAVVTATLVDLANGDRGAENLGTLTVNPVLVAAAKAKADDMAAKGYFAHVSPDGRDSWTWFKDAGYSFSFAGENLAVNFADSEDVEEAWMKSPTHRANIMNGKFSEIGIATAVGEYKGKKTTFVVQMFGRPSLVQATVVRPLSETSVPEDIAVATTEPESLIITETVPAEGEPIAASIETDAPPANTVVISTEREGDVLGFFTTSPQTLLRAIYLLSAIIILVALILTTELEFKRHHLRHVAAATFMLALMGSLFIAADRLVFTEPIIAGAHISIE